MRIRTMFLFLALALLILLGGLGLWQVQDSNNKVRAVKWLQQSNLLVDLSQQTAKDLAIERGITAYLLEENMRRQDVGVLQIRLLQQRMVVDEKLRQVSQALATLHALEPQHPLSVFQQQVSWASVHIEEQRHQVSLALHQQGQGADVGLWIQEISSVIEVLHNLASVSMLPLEGNIYSYAAQPIVKDVLFTLAEYLGRDRALLVANIVRGESISAKNQAELQEQYSVVQQSYTRAKAILKQLPEYESLQVERQNLEAQMQAYQIMRQDILQASSTQYAYPVTGELWFAQATRTIDTVYRLTGIINGELDDAVNELKANAVKAQQIVAVVLLALLSLLGVSAYIMRRRIIAPVVTLTKGASAIACGQLEHPLAGTWHKDEIGALAQMFEAMRLQLLAQRKRDIAQTQELNKLSSAIEHSVVAVVITDNQGCIEYVNTQFEIITGYSKQELIGQKAGVWSSGETERERYQKLWDTVLSGEVWIGEILNKRKNGDYYWASMSISPIVDDLGNITHFINIHLDISEHKNIAEKLKFISYYNQTTNLPNRYQLSRRFSQANKHCAQQSGSMALISISIGRLKHINDSFGREVGDSVLCEVGRKLKECTSYRDTVAHQEGGKFTVLLCRVRDAQDAIRKAEKMMTRLSESLSMQQHQIQLFPRAGVCLVSAEESDFEQEIKNADMALHFAEQGAQTVRFYNAEMDVSAQQKMIVESALHKALENQEFELHYQPKVNTATGEIYAVEALVRWPTADSSDHNSPAVFIPIAESSGLIHALGEWVLKEACRQAVAWHKQGINNLIMAVNVSIKQFHDVGFVGKVVNILQKNQMPPERLEIELTESVMAEDLERTLVILNALKALGVKLAIDDFGTGYSSLSYLSHLPIDCLKIDRSFIENITQDLRSAAIVNSVITLAQRMDLSVIAEGVETEGQLRYLVQHGCQEIQGFLFSRPLPAEEFEQFFKQYRPVRLVGQTERFNASNV